MRSIGGSIGPLILCLSLLLHGVAARNFKRNAIPKYQFDDNTAPCAWWLDNDKEGSWTCQGIQDAFAVSMVDFLRWNPSVPSPCGTLKTEWSFCLATYEGWRTPAAGSQGTVTVTVPATDAAAPTTVTVASTVSVTNTVTATTSVTVGRTVISSVPVTFSVTMFSSVRITATATVRTTVPTTVPTTVRVTTTVENVVRTTVTTTVTAQGGPTPIPSQPGMVGNCKAFYFVRWGDTCDGIVSNFGISTGQLVAWNPQARSDCTKLLAETFCCVWAY